MNAGGSAVVIGAGGGIGRALVSALAASGRHRAIHALARTAIDDGDPAVVASVVDIADERSIERAAARIDGPVDLVLIATGLLHEAGHMPERSLRELAPDPLARMFQINTIGPALVLKHFVPLLPRDRRSVVAALSARVGSIGDNRAGGWYGYRASKAALNMIVRTAAIEIARTHRQALCVALHPGTVDTGLSRPFQARVPPGRLFDPAFAAARLIDVVDGLSTADSGRCFAWDGSSIDP